MKNTNQQLEIWKDVVGYEGYYQVSNLGTVKSLDRNVKHPNGGISFVKGKMIKLCFSFRGYLQVALNKDGNKKTIKVHQLVAMSFLKHKPCGMKLVLNHINFNKLDNRVENLEWCTISENAKHAYSIGLSVVSDKTKERFLILNKSRCKKVIDTKSGIVYNSTKDVSEVTGEKERTIRARLSGQNKNNTTFRYL